MHCCNRRNRVESSSATKVAVSEDKEQICEEWLRDFEKTQEGMAKAKETERAAQAEKLRAEEDAKALSVLITKTDAGENIGIDCDKTLRVVAVNDGLIQDWNSQNPGAQVRVGDRIISVNGVYRSTTEMVQEVGKSLELRLKFQQSPVAPATIGAVSPEMIGVSADRHDGSSSSRSSAQQPRPLSQRTASQGYSADALHPLDRGSSDDDDDRPDPTVLHIATDEELNAMRWQDHPEDPDMKVIHIHLTKTDEVKTLGVDAKKEGRFALRVSGFNSGLIPLWNENHPDAQIEVGDCIVAVNGTRGTTDRMVQTIAQSKHLRLTFQRDGKGPAVDEDVS